MLALKLDFFVRVNVNVKISAKGSDPLLIQISRRVCMRNGIGISIGARVLARVRFRLRLRELKHFKLVLC